MATESSIPDYKGDILKDLEEFKNEFTWAFDNPHKVSKEKIEDFKGGIKNIKHFIKDKITDEMFIRDLDRFQILISNLPSKFTDIDKERMEMLFERLEKLIKDLG